MGNECTKTQGPPSSVKSAGVQQRPAGQDVPFEVEGTPDGTCASADCLIQNRGTKPSGRLLILQTVWPSFGLLPTDAKSCRF